MDVYTMANSQYFGGSPKMEALFHQDKEPKLHSN